MSSSGTPVYKSSYQSNPGVRLVYPSSYQNNPGVISVYTSSYENTPGVMLIHYSSYANNPGVIQIYQSGCFPKNELVQVDSTLFTPIGLLKIGDKICSWDHEKRRKQFTYVKNVHKYIVNEIICFNDLLRVSSSHPLMVMGYDENLQFVPKWKAAFDINVGDIIVGPDGKFITVKTKNVKWYQSGIEVINLSTDSGEPFIVGNCVARAENAQDNLGLVETPFTKMLAS